MLRILALAFIVGMIGVGCSPSQEPNAADRISPAEVPDPPTEDKGPNPVAIVSGVGMIVYQNLEGGFYGLVDDDGTKYDPLNLAEAFKQDSLRVRFRAEKQTDVMTTRMWGTPVKILEMLVVEVSDQ